ncbi:hypothetical protein DXX93_17930 [Thalassotalea euphylliae]|uniref:Uncharacterized protein n=1 Tax=Thalassotalea euphylliae TaxID=1655234 RepID=A0A3E0TUA7_9GAMM|nr:hypothetical protein [Thalassotalea euphylliae]REL28261.1 hypothetical protein DXX93_17930 [Thalassotalea euphylliae]
MREFKYQNESGTQVGKWYLNRLDYFEFHRFEGFFLWQVKSVAGVVLAVFLLGQLSLLFWLPLIWLAYVSGLTLWILKQQRCKFKGYFLFPHSIVTNLKSYKKEHDLLDFDSLATLARGGASKAVASVKLNDR